MLHSCQRHTRLCRLSPTTASHDETGSAIALCSVTTNFSTSQRKPPCTVAIPTCACRLVMTGRCATHNSLAFFLLAGHSLWWFGQSACTQHNVVTIGGYTRQCKCSAYPSLASEPMMACTFPSLTSGPCSLIQSFHPAALFS